MYNIGPNLLIYHSAIHIFVSDSSLRVIEAKVRTVSGQLIDLVPSTASQTANSFSLTNLPAGVYTLDVITEKGNTKAAYEGILVISQQSSIVINENTKTIINKEINRNEEDDDNDDHDGGRDGHNGKPCPRGYVGKPPFCHKPRPPCFPPFSICHFPPHPPFPPRTPVILEEEDEEQCNENPDLPQCQALFNGGKCPEGQSGTQGQSTQESCTVAINPALRPVPGQTTC